MGVGGEGGGGRAWCVCAPSAAPHSPSLSPHAPVYSLVPVGWFMMRVLTTSKGVDTRAEMRPETREPTTWEVSPSVCPVSFSTTCFVWS